MVVVRSRAWFGNKTSLGFTTELGRNNRSCLLEELKWAV